MAASARTQRQEEGALNSGAGWGAARRGRHVPGSPDLRAPHQPFSGATRAAQHSPRGVTLISGILPVKPSQRAGPPGSHETPAPETWSRPRAPDSRLRTAQVQSQRRQLPARRTETLARATGFLIGRPAASPGRRGGGTVAEGRAAGPAAAAAAQVSSGGAGEWSATGSRRRQGNPAQPSWASALPRGRSGTPQAWEEAAEDPAPTRVRTPSSSPLPRDSAGAGPAQDRGHTLPESRVPAWRHLEPHSQARFPGLPHSHPLGLGCPRAALFSWGPSACRQPQDEP